MIFVVLLILFSIFGVIFWFVKKRIEAIDSTMNGAAVNTDMVSSAQQFIPFDEIKNGIIHLGGHEYRVILEVSSTNYGLKTEKEKQMIEGSFQRALNSLQFPISFFIQTRVIDDSKMLELLDNELLQTIQENPQFEEYAIAYSGGMHSLHEKIGNNKQKKKYIVIPFDDAKNLTDLNDDEKYEESCKEIMLRASIIADLMQSVGLKATPLGTEGLLELFYSMFHKDDYRNVEHVISGEFLDLIVEGDSGNLLRDILPADKVDVLIYEMQKRLRDEVLSKNLSEEDKNLYRRFFNDLTNMRTDLKDHENLKIIKSARAQAGGEQ